MIRWFSAAGVRPVAARDRIKRVRRWTLNILAGLSLVLFVLTVIFWVRSYWREDISYWNREHLSQAGAIRTLAVGGSASGEVYLQVLNYSQRKPLGGIA